MRNTLKYVSAKDRKEFVADLKKIYTAADEKTAAKIRDEIEQKWAKKYPHAKALFLATEQATKKWTMPIPNWGLIFGELSIMFEGRLPL